MCDDGCMYVCMLDIIYLIEKRLKLAFCNRGLANGIGKTLGEGFGSHEDLDSGPRLGRKPWCR